MKDKIKILSKNQRTVYFRFIDGYKDDGLIAYATHKNFIYYYTLLFYNKYNGRLTYGFLKKIKLLTKQGEQK